MTSNNDIATVAYPVDHAQSVSRNISNHILEGARLVHACLCSSEKMCKHKARIWCPDIMNCLLSSSNVQSPAFYHEHRLQRAYQTSRCFPNICISSSKPVMPTLHAVRCDGVLHVASKHVCQQHYSSQAILLDYASKSAFVFIYLGRDDSCHVEESCHYSLSLSDRPETCT